jgi:PTH1 family peptidyl-tRNA hydrolase
MKIIIGLGNPGDKYKTTRHNAGFLAVDKFAELHGGIWQVNKKFKAEVCKLDDCLLVKPQTYMNESGIAVSAVLSFYKMLPKKIGLIKAKQADLNEVLTVIHDDLDILLGKYKISSDSRSAGHNGVQSIIDNLKTKNFKRIRIGIKTDDLEKIPADKFVLGKFKNNELKIVDEIIDKIIKGI